MKEKKLIIGLTAIIVIIIIAVAIFVTGKKEDSQDPTTQEVVTTTTVASANDDQTNFWDSVEIFEGDGDSVIIDAQEPVVETDENGEAVTDENGEKVTKPAETKSEETISEEYPGQADGWSPIVSPEDLEK